MREESQLSLFPCRRYVGSTDDFVENVLRFKWFGVDDIQLLIKVGRDAEKELVEHAFALGFIVSGQLGLRNLNLSVEDISRAIVDEENFLATHTCQLCDDPAEYHLECSCGTYILCDYHRDRHPVVMDHGDHECSPECCADNHRPLHLQICEPFSLRLECTKREGILRATLKFNDDPPSLHDELY